MTMRFAKIRDKGQARLFESRYLEMLTKTHPLIIWGMYLPPDRVYALLQPFRAAFLSRRYRATFCRRAFIVDVF